LCREIREEATVGAGIPCETIAPEGVTALFDRWNAAVGTGDPDKVVRCYASDAVLLPTLDDEPLIGTAAIRRFYARLLTRHPQVLLEVRNIATSCNVAFDAGIYTVVADGIRPGTRKPLLAHFTFIYEPRGGPWLIVHHHSSAMP
jgi:uncharacterized protein (TIGR02246 family)